MFVVKNINLFDNIKNSERSSKKYIHSQSFNKK